MTAAYQSRWDCAVSGLPFPGTVVVLPKSLFGFAFLPAHVSLSLSLLSLLSPLFSPDRRIKRKVLWQVAQVTCTVFGRCW